MFESTSSLLGKFSGTLTWAVRSNNGGIPGAIVSTFTGTTNSITTADTGAVTKTGAGVDIPSNQIVQMDFNIPTVTLPTGTYWLTLKENSSTTPNDGSEVFWLTSATRKGLDLRADNNEANPTAWDLTVPRDVSFQLRNVAVVPEAGTLALLGFALVPVGVGLARRRK